MRHPPVSRQPQFAVRAERLDLRPRRLIKRRVKINRMVAIRDQVVIRLNAIRHVRMTENPPLQQAFQRAGVKLRRNFQQFLQVNDLMVAPVADIRPRVVRLRNFPFNPLARDAVRIVAVGGRGVQKFRNQAFAASGIGERQRLPVLENVAPVALIIEVF